MPNQTWPTLPRENILRLSHPELSDSAAELGEVPKKKKILAGHQTYLDELVYLHPHNAIDTLSRSFYLALFFSGCICQILDVFAGGVALSNW